jgi:hypothetical protein
VLTDGLRETAAAYREACQAINQRLRRCEEFLAKGLRSEALHLAEAEPPVLDTLASLDFPERSQWDELAATYGLSPAPKLNVATAEALNRAYAEEEPLRQLLKDHRRLNLVHAAVRDRLAVLRQLRTLDAGNAVWAEDIRTFEAARHRELHEEVEEAIDRRDVARLSACWDEFQRTPWLAPPPPALATRLQSESLHRLASELYQAYQRFDQSRARQLRDQWNRLAPESVLPAHHPAWDRARVALDWLRRQEELQAHRTECEATLADLERALATDTPTEQLRELWSRVRELRVTVPRRLDERLTERITELRKQADWRERVILGVSFSIGALILVGFLLFVMLRSR